MKNAKVAFWTACEIETIAFYIFIFPLKLNLYLKYLIYIKRRLSLSINVPKLTGKKSLLCNFPKIFIGPSLLCHKFLDIKFLQGCNNL